ncbi:unnamed protein product [Amoebophrya sp. A25]|nr:unnamed protein product [Amoebophrya sp. A25]|eukprot:GSA25T00016990001.1
MSQPAAPSAEAPQHQPEVISNLDGYRRVDLATWKQGDQIGKGGSGEVFKAMVGGHFFAVKKISLVQGDVTQQSPSKTKEFTQELEALRAEIELLRQLDHPRVVRYIGCLLDGGSASSSGGGGASSDNSGASWLPHNLLIFLEYMPCGSMSTVLRKFGPYGVHLAKKYLKQILEGLLFLE